MANSKTLTTVLTGCSNGRITAGTISVQSTTGFLPSGSAVLFDADGKNNTFTYTGTTATTFTGVAHRESDHMHYRLTDYPIGSSVVATEGDTVTVLTDSNGTRYRMVVTIDGRLELWPLT